jgi:hypothetical protein
VRMGELREREMLERARRGLGPSAGDVARIRQGVFAALAAGVPGATSPDTPTLDPDVAGDAAGAVTWVVKLAVAGTVALAAGLGYVVGHRAGVEEGRSRVPAPVATAVSSTAAVPETPDLAFSAVPPPTREIPTAVRLAVPADVPRAAPSASSNGNRAAFEEEVIQLRRVQRALREGNPRLALALLGDLDRAVPHGRLGEERFAAGVMARCALGVGPPAVLAADFAAKYPGSVYSARVVQACGESPDR